MPQTMKETPKPVPTTPDTPPGLLPPAPLTLARPVQPAQAPEILGGALVSLAQEHNLATLKSSTAEEIVHEHLVMPTQVLKDFVDTGDVLAIIGKSKCRKSWFALQLAICLATGNSFMGWDVKRPMSVALFQLEVQEAHYKKRVQTVCNSMFGNAPQFQKHLGNLRIFSCRGKEVNREQLLAEVTEIRPEAAIIDPLYMLLDEENASDSMKATVKVFLDIAETGALACYVHHDKKGKSGDLDPTDRGSGHGILGRSYDASLLLDPHSESAEHTVITPVYRNYVRTEPICATWEGCVFEVDEQMEATPETSQTAQSKRQRAAPMDDLVGKAVTKLPGGDMWLTDAVALLTDALCVGERKASQIMQKLRDKDFGIFTDKTHKHGRVELIRNKAASSEAVVGKGVFS